MIIAIGEILIDFFPDYRSIGGAPFNFAFHLKKFGLPVRFFSRIGDDAIGRDILSLIRESGFDPADLQVDTDRTTGRVEVALTDQGVPCFTIVENAAYDALKFDGDIRRALLTPPQLLYFGSLVQRTANGFRTLNQVLTKTRSTTIRFYDMNLRPGCLQPHIIIHSLKHADILKLNAEELEITTSLLGLPGTSEPEVIDALQTRFGIKTVAVTRGADGSALYTAEGNSDIAAPRADDRTDTVGAGDAYSAVLALGVLLGWTPEKILASATRFAAHICTVKGAIPAADPMYAEIRAHMGERAS